MDESEKRGLLLDLGNGGSIQIGDVTITVWKRSNGNVQLQVKSDRRLDIRRYNKGRPGPAKRDKVAYEDQVRKTIIELLMNGVFPTTRRIHFAMGIRNIRMSTEERAIKRKIFEELKIPEIKGRISDAQHAYVREFQESHKTPDQPG